MRQRTVAGGRRREHGGMTPSPQMRILSLALKASGGEAPLAKALGVPVEALARWLGGHDALPASIYFKARALVTPRR